MRIFLVLFMSVILVGCSPDYNWRTTTLGAGEVTGFFPDKPLVQQRVLDFSGQKITFSLTTATVDGAVFAVGYAPLPPAMQNDPAARTELMASTMRSLYQNMGQAVPDPLPAPGQHFEIQGQAVGNEARLQATVWLTEHALVEGLVSAAAANFPDDQANEFFRGLSVPAK